MKIGRDNYEIWFLDYLEGNLEKSMIDDFLLFLQENPDLAEELRLYELVVLPEPEPVFFRKNRLYKQSFDVPEVFESSAVGLMEGDLGEETQQSFARYLKDRPDKSREMELFRLTRLIPENNIVFREKQKLYRYPRLISITPSFLLKIAAVFLFIWTTAVIFEHTDSLRYSRKTLTIYTSEHPYVIKDNYKETGVVPSPYLAHKETTVISGRPDNIPEESYFARSEHPVIREEQNTQAYSGRSDQLSLLSVTKVTDPVYLTVEEPELMISSATFELMAQNSSEVQYLSEKLVNKIGLRDLNMGKIVRWGLTLASGISKGKFNYSTGDSGEIIALNLDTRLLGFSIPVNEK